VARRRQRGPGTAAEPNGPGARVPRARGPEVHGPEARGPEAEGHREPRDPEAAARQICYRLLTLAPRTRTQLADALRRRDVPDDVATAVLDQLTDSGLINDAAFAKAWVESRHYGRGLSRRSLSAELRQRGVVDDDIDEAIETLEPEQEITTARRLVERKVAATRGQPADTRMRRIAGMLARKGYPAGLAFRLIREALEAEGANPQDTAILDDPAIPDDAEWAAVSDAD